MGMLQTSGSTKHWPEELSPRRSHPSQNNSAPFLGVEIQVQGPPDALHNPSSTQGGGGNCLTLISPITKPLDTERIKSPMFCVCLLLRRRAVCLCPLHTCSHTSMYALGQKHQQQCMTCFTPYRETLKYSIPLFSDIPLNQG